MSLQEMPKKEDISREIQHILSTLSDEYQNLAIRKAQELNFDFSRGSLSLDESLVNLSAARDLLMGAAGQNKLTQVPLKIQKSLYSSVKSVSDRLKDLVEGTDSILSLEDSVEELTALIWQYNLSNLSDQVLGYQAKINRLKAQEVLIQQVHRKAEQFATVESDARKSLERLAELQATATERNEALQRSLDQASGLFVNIGELQQKAIAAAAQIGALESTSVQNSSSAKSIVADLAIVLDKARAYQSEIDTTRSQFGELTTSVAKLLADGERSVSEALDSLKIAMSSDLAESRSELEGLAKSVRAASEKASEDVAQAVQGVTDSVENHIAASERRVSTVEAGLVKKASEQLKVSDDKVARLLQDTKLENDAFLADSKESAEKLLGGYEQALKNLVAELTALEERIRQAIERATGYTLFHSFQRRQVDLEKSKKFWAIALAVAVAVSVGASFTLINSLSGVKTFDALFYLKLSISLPLAYAIAFCSIQYSRERRLEEEYAFKSSISISLEPYQKLVDGLVDRTRPDEVAKYTAFIIESVNRVFTSPTAQIFEDRAKDGNTAEKVLKAASDLIEPLVKVIKR